MRPNRVDCQYCKNFKPVVTKDDNLIGKTLEKAKCKLGKRVMFRMPTSDYHWDTGGYYRYCNEYKKP